MHGLGVGLLFQSFQVYLLHSRINTSQSQLIVSVDSSLKTFHISVYVLPDEELCNLTYSTVNQ